MSEIKELRLKVYEYVERISKDKWEIDQLIYRIYKALGHRGLIDFVAGYMEDTGEEFIYTPSSAYRVAMVEDKVSSQLPWSKYPDVNKTVRRMIYESKNTEHYIHLIQEGEAPDVVFSMIKKERGNGDKKVLCSRCKKEI